MRVVGAWQLTSKERQKVKISELAKNLLTAAAALGGDVEILINGKETTACLFTGVMVDGKPALNIQPGTNSEVAALLAAAVIKPVNRPRADLN